MCGAGPVRWSLDVLDPYTTKKFPRLLVHHARVPDRQRGLFHDIIGRFTAWEQDILLEGRHPVVGFYGEPLKRDLSGVFGWQGGFKARMEAFQFVFYYRTLHMCDACDAMLTSARADPELTYKSFADNAQWRATEYSNEDLKMQYSPMWLIRGFGHAQAFRDELHLLPAGITKFVVANTVRFWEKSGLLAAWALGRELDHHHPLDALWDDYSAWLKRKGFRHRCGRSFSPPVSQHRAWSAT